MRRVPVHVRMNGGDLAHVAGGQEICGVGYLPGGTPLMSDLHRALSRFLVSGSHPFGVIHGERHGLFLVHVLAGIERGYEMLAMQVLRRGDQYRVDALIVEQISMIQVSLRVWGDLLGVLQALRVNVGERHELSVRTRDGVTNVLHPTVAGPDDAESNPVVGS